MNKREFIEELANALEGKLPEADIKEIASDYGNTFDNEIASGKSEEDISIEMGSPAKIARTILEGGSNYKSQKNERNYTDFQKNINEKTSKMLDRFNDPNSSIENDELAPMSKRIGAYVIDSIILGIVAIGIFALLFAPLMFLNYTDTYSTEVCINNGISNTANIGFGIMKIMPLILLLSAFNFFTMIFIWASNGYTPGKWLLKIRVVKINGSKINLFDAFLREFVIKCVGNSMLSGMLNMGSLIWGCVTDDHKTVHDLVAQTRVVDMEHSKSKNKETLE